MHISHAVNPLNINNEKGNIIIIILLLYCRQHIWYSVMYLWLTLYATEHIIHSEHMNKLIKTYSSLINTGHYSLDTPVRKLCPQQSLNIH